MDISLPPGPRMPSVLQTIGWWSRPIGFLERCRARYGKRFTVHLTGQSTFVVLSDPEEIQAVFQAPPDVLHPGEGAKILEPIVGRNSVILLDEDPHLEQRKLLLPAFHGEKMQSLAGLMRELAEREVETWPLDEPVSLSPQLQRLTLEIILRAVFGLERGAQLDSLREVLSQILTFGDSPLSLLPPVQRLLAGRGPMALVERTNAQADELIYALIDERRGDGNGGGDDVLAMLLEARHGEGSPMSPKELRDELMTALVAGHETTASQLAWAIDRIAREQAVQERLLAEIDGESDDAYLTATINEILRHRPVLPNAEPRLVKKPIEIGGITYQPGVVLFASAYLVHHDPDIYPDPYAFRPDRFLDKQPGTYTWIPFGGGRRRCLGAAFAQLEMKLALQALLKRCSWRPAGLPATRTRRRGIAIRPPAESMVLLSARSRDRARMSAPADEAAALA
jgi:cytochrome P450